MEKGFKKVGDKLIDLSDIPNYTFEDLISMYLSPEIFRARYGVWPKPSKT